MNPQAGRETHLKDQYVVKGSFSHHVWHKWEFFIFLPWNRSRPYHEDILWCWVMVCFYLFPFYTDTVVFPVRLFPSWVTAHICSPLLISFNCLLIPHYLWVYIVLSFPLFLCVFGGGFFNFRWTNFLLEPGLYYPTLGFVAPFVMNKVHFFKVLSAPVHASSCVFSLGSKLPATPCDIIWNNTDEEGEMCSSRSVTLYI